MAYSGDVNGKRKRKIDIASCDGSIENFRQPGCFETPFALKREKVELTQVEKVYNYVTKSEPKKEQDYWVLKVAFRLHLLIGKRNYAPKLRIK